MKMPTTLLTALALMVALPLPAPAQESVGGNITDSRDGQRYRTVKIGKDTWMAENLNYKTDSSYCYDNADSTCAKYGRLYTWNTAKSVCPSGWHLPSREEWGGLIEAAGGKEVAGKKLKSKIGWGTSGNATDELGFSAVPAGYRDSDGDFGVAGHHGYFWSTADFARELAYNVDMSNNSGYVGEDIVYQSSGMSVRCVMD